MRLRCVQRVCTMPMPGIGELVDDAVKPVGRRDEVGVEDGDELALGDLEAFFECAGLVAVAVGAVEVDDGLRREAFGAGGIALDDGFGDDGGLVGGVVEDLDLEAVARILDAAAGVDEAVDDELLVIDGELDGDEGELVFGEARGRLVRVRGLALVAVVEPDELVAMDAVEGEDDHHDEVRDEQADVEGVPAVVAAEGAVGVVGLPIVAEAVLVGEEERESVDGMCQGYGSPENVGFLHFMRREGWPRGAR